MAGREHCSAACSCRRSRWSPPFLAKAGSGLQNARCLPASQGFPRQPARAFQLRQLVDSARKVVARLPVAVAAVVVGIEWVLKAGEDIDLIVNLVRPGVIRLQLRSFAFRRSCTCSAL